MNSYLGYATIKVMKRTRPKPHQRSPKQTVHVYQRTPRHGNYIPHRISRRCRAFILRYGIHKRLEAYQPGIGNLYNARALPTYSLISDLHEAPPTPMSCPSSTSQNLHLVRHILTCATRLFNRRLTFTTTPYFLSPVDAETSSSRIDVAKVLRSSFACSLGLVSYACSEDISSIPTCAARIAPESSSSVRACSSDRCNSATIDLTLAASLVNTRSSSVNIRWSYNLHSARRNTSLPLSRPAIPHNFPGFGCYPKPYNVVHAQKSDLKAYLQIPVVFSIANNHRRQHNNATRRRVQVLMTERLLSRCNGVIKVSQPNNSLKVSFEREKATPMVYEMPVGLPFTLLNPLFWQLEDLPGEQTMLKEGVIKVNAPPVPLLLMTERNIRQSRVRPCPMSDLERALVSSPTGQIFGLRHQHTYNAPHTCMGGWSSACIHPPKQL